MSIRSNVEANIIDGLPARLQRPIKYGTRGKCLLRAGQKTSLPSSVLPTLALRRLAGHKFKQLGSR